jgi:hypothetical protein
VHSSSEPHRAADEDANPPNQSGHPRRYGATEDAFEQPLSDVSAVALSLQATPAPASEVLDDGELLPTTPGFYGWWSRQGAIAGLPHVAHPLEGELSLLYIGISPVREASRQTIRSRVIGNHLKGKRSGLG